MGSLADIIYQGKKHRKKKAPKHKLRTFCCETCGKENETHHPYKRYCDLLCSEKAQRKRAAMRRQAKMSKAA